ncbi:MAG: hypothetical protein J5J00_08220 [Deltaproteobacteria bacterium]|nr:hypothetical protein [Deltaproteobacteria bacterium]
MITKDQKAEKGWSLLESSLLMSLVMAVIGVVFSFVQYAWTARSLEAIVERHIRGTGLKPYRLESGIDANLMSFKTGQLAAIIDKFASEIEQDLKLNLASQGIEGKSRYFVESAYAEIEIDPATGVSKGLRQLPVSYRAFRGDTALLYELDLQDLLNSEFEKRTKSVLRFDAAFPTVSTYAVPTAALTAESAHNFLPTAVLVAAAASISLEDTWAGALLSALGTEPVVYSNKVVSLRGEVGE